MLLITPFIAISVFLVIVIIAIIIAYFYGDYASYDRTSIHSFMNILAGLGIIITFLFYLNVVRLQGEQIALAELQQLSILNDSQLNSVLSEIQTASAIIPNFVYSITPLTNTVCCYTGGTAGTGGTGPLCPPLILDPDPVNSVTCSEKMTLSYRIFSLWQDYLLSNHYTQNYDQLGMNANFLQRANSSQLYEQWTVTKLNFTSNAQTYGDLLFKYGLPITVQVPQSYIEAAQQLMNDPAYKGLVN